MFTDIITSAAGLTALVIVYGICVGVLVTTATIPERRTGQAIAAWGLVLIGVVVVFAITGTAPWAGVAYALALAFAGAFTSAALLRDNPLLAGEPFLRRVILSITQARRLREAQTDAAEQTQTTAPTEHIHR